MKFPSNPRPEIDGKRRVKILSAARKRGAVVLASCGYLVSAMWVVLTAVQQPERRLLARTVMALTCLVMAAGVWRERRWALRITEWLVVLLMALAVFGFFPPFNNDGVPMASLGRRIIEFSVCEATGIVYLGLCTRTRRGRSVEGSGRGNVTA